jgi:hypothetical protein
LGPCQSEVFAIDGYRTLLAEKRRLDIEERYFITSLSWDNLSPKAILRVVRNHWAIKKKVFNSLDLCWREDDAPWCSRGQAVWVLGLLRLMASGLVQFCRKCHLHRKSREGKRPELSVIAPNLLPQTHGS